MGKPPPLPAKERPRATPPPLPPRAWRHLTPRDLRKFKNLLFVARTIVEGAYSGLHKSPYRGSSPEFVEYRAYHPGDALSMIDWKAYARTDRYFVRLTEKETNMECHVLLDCSASMSFSDQLSQGKRAESDSKLHYASTLAAALAYLMIKQGDRAGLTLFDQKIRRHIPTGGTLPHLYRILSELERQKPEGATNVAAALERAAPLFRRRGLLVILSDFYGDLNPLFRALGHFRHRRFDIMLLHVLHARELELPDIPNARFVDAESGALLTCNPADLREAYAARLQAHREHLRRQASARGMDYQFIHTGQPYDQALHAYLTRRATANA